MTNQKNFFWKDERSLSSIRDKRKLFLDLGANVGQSVTAFLNWKGEEAKRYDVYSFEPNIEFIPEWINKVMPLQDSFASINLIPAALGSSESKQLIYFDGWQLSQFGGVDQRKRAVISFDFVKWFKEISASYIEIIMKMDIEGGEYNLIMDIAKEGILERVSELFIEIHGHKRGYSSKETQELIAMIYKNGIAPLMWEACAETNQLKFDPRTTYARIVTDLENIKNTKDFNGIHKYVTKPAQCI